LYCGLINIFVTPSGQMVEQPAATTLIIYEKKPKLHIKVKSHPAIRKTDAAKMKASFRAVLLHTSVLCRL